MKIASWNVNGIRAVHRKGDLHRFLETFTPDVLLFQETKATQEQVLKEMGEHPDYDQHFHSAERPGYAGTAFWIRKKSFQKNEWTISTGMPDFADTEGRIIRGDFQKWSILGVYFPNGGKSPEAWKGKLLFYEQFLKYVNALRAQGRSVIFCGDVNCAHEEIDLARPKENQKSIGFLPEERAWVTKVIENDWVDVFREKNPKTIQYSWWDVLTRARSRNVGWRLDYFFIDKKLFSHVHCIDYLDSQMGSDHCPVMIDVKTL